LEHDVTRKSLICAALLIVAPTVADAQNAPTLAKSANEIISRRLLDPASLQIRNIAVKTAISTNGQKVTILCGEYNAKNRFGGYIGFKQFVYEPAVLQGIISFQPDLAMEFMSVSGTDDFSHDPRADIKAGRNLDNLRITYAEAGEYAIKYLPVCLGAG
jgi:hypothetical protein